ncbi:MAG: signal peptidase I [Verrucomicrobia bacterium]|nr:signal peptidase I [Verrucomicrobiota bacterium]
MSDLSRVRRSRQHLRLVVLISVLVGVLLVWRSHFRLTLVVGQSMLPTFSTGDLLLVDQQVYRNVEPRRGDIVVARYNEDLIVKRVVGLPGEEVELDKGRLCINGRPTALGHSIQPGLLSIGRGKLLEQKFALLGDNRALPLSQVVHAVVARDQIVGQVIFSLRLRKPHPIPPTET